MSPYAYQLTGFTLMTIASYGISEADQTWNIALNRTEETLLGVFVVLLVAGSFWPRYARPEFLQAVNELVRETGALAHRGVRESLSGESGSSTFPQAHKNCTEKLFALQALLTDACREQPHLGTRNIIFERIIASLQILLQCVVHLHQHQVESPEIMRLLEAELSNVCLAVESAFQKLCGPYREDLTVEPLNTAIERLVTRIDGLYQSGAFRTFQVDEITALYVRGAFPRCGNYPVDGRKASDKIGKIRGKGVPSLDLHLAQNP